MKEKRKHNPIELRFDWGALFVLCLGIEATLLASAIIKLSDFYLALAIAIISWVLVVRLYRRYNWKNVSAAVILLISTFHPIRFIYDWWLNPILYAVLALICAIFLVQLFRKCRWKNYFAVLLLLFTCLTTWQMIASVREIGNCYVEDRRWNEMYGCSATYDCYQQIQQLPIAMSGWCYYRLWY